MMISQACNDALSYSYAAISMLEKRLVTHPLCAATG